VSQSLLHTHCPLTHWWCSLQAVQGEPPVPHFASVCCGNSRQAASPSQQPVQLSLLQPTQLTDAPAVFFFPHIN